MIDQLPAGAEATAVPGFMDEGDPSFGAHQGANNTNRELHVHDPRKAMQGAKTRKAAKDIISRRS